MEQGADFFPRLGEGILLGALASLVSAVLFAFLFAALLAMGVPDGALPFFAHLTVLLSGAAGGLLSGVKGKERGLLLGLCTGAALFLVHLLLTVILGDLSLSLLTYCVAEVGGGALGGILGVNLRRN